MSQSASIASQSPSMPRSVHAIVSPVFTPSFLSSTALYLRHTRTRLPRRPCCAVRNANVEDRWIDLRRVDTALPYVNLYVSRCITPQRITSHALHRSSQTVIKFHAD